MEPALAAFADRLPTAGVLLDFDGTLSEIVPHAADARPVAGAAEALAALARRTSLVAVVTGRPGGDLRARLDVPGVEVIGLYGLEDAIGGAPDGETVARAAPDVEAIAARVEGAWVERKGLSLAVHYRQARDPDGAALVLRPLLEQAAAANGLELLEGKRVLELATGRPSKGRVVTELARARSLAAALYAGDDVADLEAFDALDRLGAGGLVTVRVAVRGPETPAALVARADVVVDGPAGLVSLLDELVSQSG